MQVNFFWNNWSARYRTFYVILMALALICLTAFSYYYISGPESIIGWDTLAKTEFTDVNIDTFKVGPFSITTEAENTIFFQQFSGSFPDSNIFSYYAFLIISVIAIVVLFTIVTTLPRIWYFIGITLFAVILVNYKLELLYLFGTDDKYGLIIAFVLYFPISWYFNAIKPETPFFSRFITILAATFIMAVIISVFAEVETPFLYLATYGMTNALIISLIFILMIAHEIIAAFMYILTSSGSSSSKNSIGHFYLISLIYIANLALAYLKESNVIDWDIIYIDLFLLLTISTIIGIWGFRQREEQYSHVIKFNPLGAFAYIALAICCFATIAHFNITLNDPALEVFRDVIIYSHLAYGVIFLVYITSNFLDPLKNNLKVYKVLYRPTNMPYFTFRLAGLIAFIGLTLKSNWEVPVNQSIAAFYNSIGDMHMSNNETQLAETYYTEASIYGINNHKSHYMLGQLAVRKNNREAAINHYHSAKKKNPTPQSFVNLSNVYMDQSMFFDALFTLNEGLEAYPKNGALLNNVGLTYTKTNIIDTAAYYLNAAMDYELTEKAAGSNILALLVRNDIDIDPDSTINNLEIADDPISLNNSIVIKNKAREYYDTQFAPEDSSISFLQSSILYNAAFNELFTLDSSRSTQLNKYISAASNINFEEKLKLIRFINAYKNQNITYAFKELNWLANTSTFKGGQYFNIVGKWALEQGAPEVAYDYFKWAADRNYKNAQFNRGIAAIENRDLNNSLAIWQELMETGDRKVQDIAISIITILQASGDSYASMSDNLKYLYIRYKINYTDTIQFNQLIEQIDDNNYRAQAIYDMSQRLWKKDLDDAAVEMYSRLSGIEISDPGLFAQLQWYELKMLAAQGNISGLSTKINEGVTFDEQHTLEKKYFTALINEASGDTTNAMKNYQYIAYRNPFKEEMTIAAANYIGSKDKFEAYDILLNGIEINPQSVRLLKAYILQCARVQLYDYAEISLYSLSQQISKQHFAEFLGQYQALVEQVKEEENNF